MKEEEIRPTALFDQYLALAEQDVFTYFNDAPRELIPCPACGNNSNTPVFTKTGFNYVECNSCKTLFVNPRPDEKSFNTYYTDSPSVQFWATHFYKETEKARRELIIRPKAIKVGQLLDRYFKPDMVHPVIIDIGAGYGVFCEELAALNTDYIIMGIEPSPALQEICRQKNIRVIPKFLDKVIPEDLNEGRCAAAISFELLEHLYNPGSFIRSCGTLLDKEGILILTTLSWDGFDLQVLREKSKSINPPHHINFFTPHSIRLLLEDNGFKLIEVTTPGKLDVDIVMKQLSDVKCEFVRGMLSRVDTPTKERFQEFLQNSLMSSHMMIVAERQ